MVDRYLDTLVVSLCHEEFSSVNMGTLCLHIKVTVTITKPFHFQLIGKARLECPISLLFVYERLRGMPRPGIELATFRSRVTSANH